VGVVLGDSSTMELITCCGDSAQRHESY
jgi:hypothetical protein